MVISKTENQTLAEHLAFGSACRKFLTRAKIKEVKVLIANFFHTHP
jgi:hypothetical protein